MQTSLLKLTGICQQDFCLEIPKVFKTGNFYRKTMDTEELKTIDPLQNTPDDHDAATQPFDESPMEMSESVWGRLIPVNSSHPEASLNKAFELRENEITLGRGKMNNIVLACPNISSKHCRLIRDTADVGDTVFLEDMSSNGTWVNKKRYHKQRVLLCDESEIMYVPLCLCHVCLPSLICVCAF